MRKKILVTYSMWSTFTPTTLEYLAALKKFTDYDVSYVHVTHNAVMDFDINDYDVVFNNYCTRFCFEGYVGDDYQNALQKFRGLKIIAIQDDYDRTATLHRAIRRLGFHVVLTCMQKEFWPLVYPRSELPGVTLVQGLTGYMPESVIENRGRYPIIPLAERKVKVGYRGRAIGARYGRLGFEKYEIGRRFREVALKRGVATDIAMDNESRIYGDAWYNFLGSCRAVLGSESGSNVFDFDSAVEKMVEDLTVATGRAPTYDEMKDVLAPLEAPFNVGQISPRVFECAAMMTPMVLFRGNYSDVLTPDVHYIPLEKDFSNAADVLDKIEDIDYLQGFADRAYDHLVKSGKFGYRALADLLRETIEREYAERIDPRWVAYRSSTAQKFAPPPPGALNEKPTAHPQDAAVLNDRLLQAAKQASDAAAAAADAQGSSIAGEQTTPEDDEHTLAYRAVRGVWRLVPLRYRRALHKAVFRS
ncbi:hypothetical protein W911_00435 [Hyphomicrobium nitrativorans NL23]|uniref:Uncharacterized protein n=1 Tax=Hyphomicrobium nitrativorans NL23 TaxID=1029756 RepID=V5SGZ9_9HYPH|nr:hypothetical protein [Hyphomicrobium nitrativorans]AHB49793.1 hypothetical protein W911_00435 [Hyphomicrobium nitrativorans NL23]